jgi:alcohol dehydrogenase class IV
MKFEFSTVKRIIFGAGTVQQAVLSAVQQGNHAFVITGGKKDRAQPLLDRLRRSGIQTSIFSVHSEPTIKIALDGVKLARAKKCDLVIAIGGGSVMDTGKVVAALLSNRGELLEYLEVIGSSKSITKQPVPCIAIPTTAGTGAEVTCNAVLGSPDHKVKVSMRSPLMFPCLTIVDPELTYSMPPDITASTGLDAFTQLLEVYVSNKSNPLTDGICIEGIKKAVKSLLLAYKQGENKSAREDMSLASLFSGLALANAKLGAVHGFAAPLGGILSAPHGVICAILLPQVIEANIQALRSRNPDSPVLKRFDRLAKILKDDNHGKAAETIKWIQDLCNELKISKLSKYGLKKEDIPSIIEKAKNSSSMKGNPIELTDKELEQILLKTI